MKSLYPDVVSCLSMLALSLALPGMVAGQDRPKSEQGQRPGLSSSQSSNQKQESGDDSKPGKRDQDAVQPKFIVNLKDGTKHQATKTEVKRNGDLRVILLDGTVITVTRKSLANIEKVSQRATGEPAIDATVQPVTAVTLTLVNGRQIVAQSVRQLDNQQWQVVELDGNLLNVDRARVRGVSTSSGGSLTPQIGSNGEISWRPESKTDTSPDRNPAPSASGVATTMLDTLSANAAELQLSSSQLRQEFLANGNFLESVDIRVTGSHPLRLRIVRDSNGETVGEQQVSTTPAGLTRFDFSPALSLVIGERHVAEFSIPQPGPAAPVIRASITSRDEYVFSGMEKVTSGEWQPDSDETGNYDLAMRIRGKQPAATPAAAPTQRALLVLLENDGIVSSLDVAGINYPNLPDVPYMKFAGEGGIKFKLNKNESIAQAIVRVNSQLRAFAESRVGPMPQPPKFNGISNPLDPNYVAALNQWQSAVQTLMMTLTNPNNWIMETESIQDFTNTISDLVVEQFTSANIQLKTAGKYDHVVILEDAQFSADNVLAKLQELAPGYLIDIHVLSHGGNNVIHGADNANVPRLERNSFFVPLQQARLNGTIPVRLRAIYQCNCLGGSLKREWMAVGAQVVGGTVGEEPGETKNNFMPQQYLHFLEHWCNQNKTFQESLDDSFSDAANYSQGVYSALSDKPALINDSKMTAAGDGSKRRQ